MRDKAGRRNPPLIPLFERGRPEEHTMLLGTFVVYLLIILAIGGLFYRSNRTLNDTLNPIVPGCLAAFLEAVGVSLAGRWQKKGSGVRGQGSG